MLINYFINCTLRDLQILLTNLTVEIKRSLGKCQSAYNFCLYLLSNDIATPKLTIQLKSLRDLRTLIKWITSLSRFSQLFHSVSMMSKRERSGKERSHFSQTTVIWIPLNKYRRTTLLLETMVESDPTRNASTTSREVVTTSYSPSSNCSGTYESR